METKVKIFRARNDSFELNNFGGEKIQEIEGRFISIEENIHFDCFPTGNVVNLRTNNKIIKVVLPIGRKTADKSSEIIKQNATVGCNIKLKASKGKTSNPQVWINENKLIRVKVTSTTPKIDYFHKNYPELYNSISKETKDLVFKNQIDVLSIIKENEALLSQFTKEAKATLLTALIQNKINKK